MSQRMYTVTPKQAKQEILDCIMVGLVPLITSSPGMGKSSIVHQLGRDYKLKLIDLRLSQCTPEDLQGFPMRVGDKASFVPFDVFPVEGDEIPEGYDGWLLFLDELTSASKPVQAAAYKIILDKMVGSRRLHENVAIVAAGNKMTDRAIVNQMSTALQSRVVHFELEVSKDEFVEHAFAEGYDSRVISFVSAYPSKLMDFKPDHQDTTFPCPRTWEFLSRLIKGKEIGEGNGAKVAGPIGEGTAVEFLTFIKEFARLPKLADILANPETAPIPAEASTKWAAVSMMVDNAEEKNLNKILAYVERYDIEFQVVFARGASARLKKICKSHTKFAEYLRKMVRYLQ